MAVPLRIAGDSKRSLPRRLRFTVQGLAAIKPPTDRPYVMVYDERTPRLAYMVTNNNARTFYYYGKVNGRPLRHRLGGAEMTIEQARTKCAKVSAGLLDGIDPQAEKRGLAAAPTFKQLFDAYEKNLSDAGKSAKNRRNDESMLNSCFGEWKARRVSEITEAHVRTLHQRLTADGRPIIANRAVQLIRRMWNWAGLKREKNVAEGDSIRMNKERSRKRFCSAEEVQRLFAAFDAEANTTATDCLRLALFSGARIGNCRSARWNEIDLAGATWTIPAEKSKSGEPMTLPLSPPALAVLNGRKGNSSEWVFPSHGATGHVIELKSVWARLCTAAELKDLRIHDLRRTLGSWQVALGASLPIIGASLGHANASSTAIYARLAIEPVRASVNAAGDALSRAARGPATHEVPKRTRRTKKRNK